MRSGRYALLPALAVAALAAALLLAACGGGGGGGYGNRKGGETATATTPTAAPNPEEGATFVSLASVPGLGLILVDSGGRTLYAFSGDGGEPACYGGCAEAWPPLLSAGEPFAGNGAAPGRLGTAARRGGETQVTYAGRPLYTYEGDKGPGEANGNGRSSDGGTWTALKANGQPAG